MASARALAALVAVHIAVVCTASETADFDDWQYSPRIAIRRPTAGDRTGGMEVYDPNQENPWARRLQAGGCQPPAINKGIWSGTSPDLTSICGRFGVAYGTANTVFATSTTFSFGCGSGYYLVGPSAYTCSGSKTCVGQYCPAQYVCVWTSYTSNGCIYCCSCTTSWSLGTVTSSCAQCVPPAAANAINPAVNDGASSYTWSCALGFYGAQVTRSCSSTGGGAWSGSPITCTACPNPAAPVNGFTSKPSTADITQFQCNPGYYNAAGPATTQLRCLPNSATYTTTGSTITSCSACTAFGAGYYCTGSAAPAQCQGGSFGSPGIIYSTATCGGSCTAGYYCPPGSTSSTQLPCGGSNVYCPTGSSQPITVTAGFYTTPTTGSVALRTGQAVCPAFRSCTNGLIDPGIILDSNVCVNGKIVGAAVQEFFVGAQFQGATLMVSTPGYTGAVAWTIDSIVAVNPTMCRIDRTWFTYTGGTITGTSMTLQTTKALNFGNCSDGFTIYFTAYRTNDATIKASCQAFTEVLQVARPPVVTDCKDRSIIERTLLGTAVGTALQATNPNIGTSILWFLNTTRTGPVPFSIGMCDGQIRVKQTLIYSVQNKYSLDIIIRNDGSSLGIGSVQVTCSMKVNVTQIPVPPVFGNTQFYIPELVPIGTWVGDLNVTDPFRRAITSVVFGNPDSPAVFRVNNTGHIFTTMLPDSILMSKAVWTITANATNSDGVMGSTTVYISLVPVPRPPATFDQSRTLAENTRNGTSLPPALFASHPQALNMTFTLTGSGTTFGCFPNGTVFLRNGPLDFYVQSVYSYGIIVTDSNGRIATATLTINVTPVPRPSYWSYGVSSFNYTLQEGFAFRRTLPMSSAFPIAASNIDTRVTQVYRILSAIPTAGNGIFALDPFTGVFTVGPNINIATGYLFDPTLTYPMPQTFQFNLAAVDSNGLSINGTAFVQVLNIQPRFILPPAQASGGFVLLASQLNAIGYMVANMSSYLWTAYPSVPVSFTMDAQQTAEGDDTFVINPVTGVISLANVTYYGGNVSANGTFVSGFGTARWNYNTRNVFDVNVTVTQGALQRLVNFKVNLPHYNRPPTWTRFPTLFAAASSPGTIGSALFPSVIYDPDALLSFVNENFTFAITGGNTDNTFNISAATGQIQVQNENTPSFVFFPGARNQFNLTISVTDGGVNGPRYTAVGYVLINMTLANFAPSVRFQNYTIPERRPYGTVVGTLNATDRNTFQRLTYALVPRGRNVNRPFPFNVTTSYAPQYSNSQGVGIITVARDPTDLLNLGLDFNEAFTMYFATVTVTDNDPTAPLSSTADVEIWVSWVPEPPYFKTSVVFMPPEHMPTGYGIGTVVGWTKDIWQRPFLTYAWSPVTPQADRDRFTLLSNGTVRLSPLAGDLALINRGTFVLTVVVTDMNSLTGNTTVTINLQDVPDAPRFVGLFNAANTASSGSFMGISETASVGSIVGYLRVTDDDATTSPQSGWGDTYFALDYAVPDASYFTIDPTTGALRTAVALDFWDQTNFTVNVSVADGVVLYTSMSWFSFSIRLTQANTVVVSSFFVDSSAPPTTAINETGVGGLQARFATAGSPVQYVYVNGRNFGPTQRRMTREGLTMTSTNVSAIVGPARYPSTCRIVIPNTRIACSVPAGVGAGHMWTITVANVWSATSTASTAYFPPIITGVYRLGGVIGDNATQIIPTDGTAFLQIFGTNFGPIGTVHYLAYGRVSSTGYEYPFGSVPPCTVTTAHTVIQCPTAAGVGFGFKFALQAVGQTSADFIGSPVAYAKPTITKVTAPTLSTRGGQPGAVYINGTNFGPAGLSASEISVAYSVDFTNPFYTQFQAANCKVDIRNPHRGIVCDSVAGVGTNLATRVIIGGQTSNVSTDKMAYASPVVIALAGPGKNKAQTVGGQEILLTGSGFGPITPLFANGTIVPCDLQPSARYGPGGIFRYTAVRCRVITADTTISCFTAEGVGKNLLWAATVGSQQSPTLMTDSSNYNPPIVASYSGSGSVNAFTQGGQGVVISGTNFGPLGTLVDSGTYGNDENGTTFGAANCTLLTAHVQVICYTIVGAGGDLKWFLTIGGQRSVTPTTAYGIPIVRDFIGIGAANASTDGGDQVTIRGEFFSVDTWLDYVTYGPSGTEFTAQNCRLSANHTAITCAMRPGVGRKLKWYVSVGKQVSLLSENTTSYGLPTITGASRLNSTTDGFIPNSNQLATIVFDGTDFAISYPLAQQVVRINNLAKPRPPQAQLDAHMADIYSGGPGITAIQQWIDSLTVLYPFDLRALGRSQHRLSVNIPEGYGTQADMFLVTGGIPSNILTFTYIPPIIRNIAPDRQNVSFGYLNVFIEGSSFCASKACGVVKIDGVAVDAVTWSHNSIYLQARDPQTMGMTSYVTVEVNGVASNRMELSRPVPNINALVSQNNYINMDTRGGEDFVVRGVLDVGGVNDTITVLINGRPCTDRGGFIDNGMPSTDRDVSYTLTCKTPEGVGRDLPILLNYQNLTSRDNPSFRFSYAPPVLLSIRMLVPFYDAATAAAAVVGNLTLPPATAAVPIGNGIPTLGAVVVLTGTNLGSSAVTRALVDDPLGLGIFTVLYHNHSMVIAVAPPGDGVNHNVRLAAGNQVSNTIPFTYAPPAITELSPNHGGTIGGTVIQVRGYNFGVTQPTISLGSRPCVIVQPFNVSVNHSTVSCVVPAGQGVDIAAFIAVNGQTSQLSTALFSYDPPTVYSVFPANGPTTGRARGPLQADGVHRDEGPRIVQMITGNNFGTYGRVSYLPYANSDPLARNFTVPSQDILSWNDSMIVYYMPTGFGYSLQVSVFADQYSLSTIEFSYDPPVVTGVTRYDRTVQQCRDFQQCFTFGNNTRCRMVPAGCFDTRGAYPLEIVGENFGIQSMLRGTTQVRIGRSFCDIFSDINTIAALSHTRLICLAPMGLGERLPVSVALGYRTSVATNTSFFSYDPPVVSLISPNTPDATGKQVLLLRGKNFGFEETPVAITINDEPCVHSEWLNDAQLRCTPPAQVVGPKNVSILVANRTLPYTFFDLEEALIYQCAQDFYGMDGEVCLDCPQGASCPGAEHQLDLVNATEGFWRMNVSSTDDKDAILFCDAPRRDTRDFCPIFMPCGPPEACLAGNICAEGYEGSRCAYCLAGKYYRQNDQCVKCPSSLPVLYAGLAVMFILIAAFAWFLNSRNVSLALISVGVDWAQVLSMFARTKIRWPKLLRQLFQVLSAFNLNLEITAPECLNPGIQFWQKWFFIEGIPLVVAGLLATVYFARYLYNAMCLSVKKSERGAHINQSVSTFIVLFRIIYLYITKTSFDVLNCTPTDPPTFRDVVNKMDSIEYMSGFVQPEYECWAKNSWQVFLFPFGVGTLVTYTFVVPSIALYKLNKHRYEIRYDQILRAKGSGDDRLTNPHFDFRMMWQKLYYHYRPDKWYWEFCITARKMFIAGTALAFRQIPSYQLAIALLVLFTAYVLHVLHWPYMSHTTKDGVLEEHKNKALYDETHMSIERTMQEMASKNIRKRQRANVFDDVKTNQKIDNAVLMIAFDANTVESILLGCCVLVALAGIMLDSKRFDGDNWFIPQVQNEYTGLTFGCLMLIVASIIYYAVVFTIEMCLVFCPAAVPQLLWLCRNRAASIDTKKAAKAKEAAAKVDSDTIVNPFLLQQEARAAEKGDSLLGNSGIIDASELMKVTQPSPALWKSVQMSYSRMMDMTMTLREEVRDARHEAELVKSSAGEEVALSTGPRTVKKRTQFGPTARAAEEERKAASRASTTSPAATGGGSTPRSAGVAGFKAAASLASLKSARSMRSMNGAVVTIANGSDDDESGTGSRASARSRKASRSASNDDEDGAGVGIATANSESDTTRLVAPNPMRSKDADEEFPDGRPPVSASSDGEPTRSED